LAEPRSKNDTLKETRRVLNARPEIAYAYVFGSFVDEETFRDLDLAIYVDPTNKLVHRLFYDIELSNQLEQLLELPVDVIVLNRAAPLMVYRASQGLLIKNDDDNTRVDFISTKWRLYWDFRDMIHAHIPEMKHGSR